ncbi:hypothetical protein ACF0H5_010260 [Mactra antiquata]
MFRLKRNPHIGLLTVTIERIFLPKMESKPETKGTGFGDLNIDENHQPAHEQRDHNPQHVGYDQPSDTRGYNLPQHALQMRGTVVNVQPSPSHNVVHTRGTDMTFPAIIACCCCIFTGIPAISYAMKAQTLYDRGDMIEGRSFKRLNLYAASNLHGLKPVFLDLRNHSFF